MTDWTGITYRVEIWCVTPKCRQQYRGYPSSSVSNLESLITETVLDATTFVGWTTKDGKHYCPKHKAAA